MYKKTYRSAITMSAPVLRSHSDVSHALLNFESRENQDDHLFDRRTETVQRTRDTLGSTIIKNNTIRESEEKPHRSELPGTMKPKNANPIIPICEVSIDDDIKLDVDTNEDRRFRISTATLSSLSFRSRKGFSFARSAHKGHRATSEMKPPKVPRDVGDDDRKMISNLRTRRRRRKRRTM